MHGWAGGVGTFWRDSVKVFCLLFPPQVKSLLAPILCKLVFSFIFPDNPDLGNAAFIYGAFPTATGVFTYCTSYGMPHETIAVAMVVGTLLSAPIMVLFGFILASVEAPTEALNATSAAVDAAYVQAVGCC